MINKQKAGFKFGKFSLKVLEHIGEVKYNNRAYRLVKVQTNNELIYFSLRLYNQNNKFIKQFLFEPEIRNQIGKLILNNKK